ncbi:methyl-accepting chemotaxis protein [Prosthecomicrobium pneumaticum]|uniref:Methyl-accepting chemotaxis protein n=1 Tax=Prosthecomicrobium pneumaticum TaxID=81895 RepID=A0A7W9L2X8_9HYPH|nr:methyl-accepting chemotaxis protein [Prosthecomicrobium pneumaticum]MBB5753967.1 methyl-accepting chemotaxis protein [Prosthecomicrobium pneumaticum]
MFKNLPLIAKIASLLLLLGVFAAGGVLFAGTKMQTIDHAYGEALEGPSRATLLLARANRFVVQYGQAVYRSLSATDAEANAAAIATQEAAIERFGKMIDAAAERLPEAKQSIEALRGRFQQFVTVNCGDVVQRANASTDAQSNLSIAAEWNASCMPLLETLTQDIAALIDEKVAALDALEDGLHAETARTITLVYSLLFGGLVVVLGIAVFATRFGIVKPIDGIRSTLESLAKNQFNLTIAGTDRKDEIGKMAVAAEELRGALEAADRAREEARLADLRAAERLKEERAAIAADFETKMGALAQALANSSSEVSQAARNLSASAEETSRQAVAVSSAAEEASNNVQTVAAATEELTSSIGEIGSQVSRAADMAVDGSQEVNRTASDIRELSEAAAKIGEVVKLITDIASQTNLLALNATIEAARAGDAGKGFAVVAQEVKQLAEQTARATQEIGHKVADIQKATGRTVGSIETIVGTISQIREATAMIASAVEEQTATTREIAANTNMAADGTGAVNDNIAGVGRAAEMTGAASTQLSSLSSSLSDQADEMQRRVDEIVRSLRASG